MRGAGGGAAPVAGPANPRARSSAIWMPLGGSAFDDTETPLAPSTRSRPLASVWSSPRKLITGAPAAFLGKLPLLVSNLTGPAEGPLIDFAPGSMTNFVSRAAPVMVGFRSGGRSPGA